MKSKFRFLSLLSRLCKNDRASSCGALMRLLRDEEGAYLLYMVFVLPVLIGVSGLAGEATLIFYNHRSLQSAADAAAYSAAIAYSYDTSADTTTQAKAIVASYGFDLGTNTNQANVPTPTILTNYAGSGQTAIQVNISRQQNAIFSSMWLSTFTNSVSATAVLNSKKSGNCIVALGNTKVGGVITPNAPDAIQLQGNPTINVPGCGVYSNSTDCSGGAVSVALGGNATINAGSLGAAGCVSVGGSSAINLPGGGAYTQSDGALGNPYAGTSLPTLPGGSCVTPPSGDITLGPGRYCSLNADHRNITLTGGIYILDSNSTSTTTVVVKNGTLTDNGAGTTLVFTSSTGQYPSTMMAVQANGTVNLTAPATGTTKGFVMMGDSTMPLTTVFSTHSNPDVTLSGTIYVPNGAFSWGGNASTGSNFCLQMIVNTLALQGDSSFGNAGCNLGNGQLPIGSIVTLVD